MFDLASAGEQWSHEARTELRYSAPRIAEVTNRRGGGSIVDSYHDDCDGPNAPKDPGALRTTLVWLDLDEYAVSDHQKFKVRIENVGSVSVEMPFSPHLADLQPADPRQKFGYSLVRVQFWIGGAKSEWTSSEGDITLYGASQYAGTMLTMHPGEWVRCAQAASATGSHEHDSIRPIFLRRKRILGTQLPGLCSSP